MASNEKLRRWLAKFSLFTPIKEKSVKNLTTVRFHTERPAEGSDGVVLKGFTISLETPSNHDEPVLAAEEKANRIFSYLSLVHRYPIDGYLESMIEDRPKGEPKTGIASLSVDAIIHNMEDLDWEGIEDLLETKDVKLLRQLANYNMGLKSVSPVEKLQKFYLVIEDEYPRTHPFRMKYEYLRIAVSHSSIGKENAKISFEYDHLNPLNPEHVRKIINNLSIIKEEAEKIIKGRIRNHYY